MFCTDKETGGFHTKGYIFRKEEIYRIIIGSSNLTMNAMTKNREWNTKIVSTAEGAMAKEVVGEFDSFWNDKRSLRYEQFIETYKTKYKIVSQQKAIAAGHKVIDYHADDAQGINATGETHEFTMPNTDKGAVEITYALETPVRDDLYDYLVG